MDSVAAIKEALSRYEGVPGYWAELFYNAGLNVRDVITWVETASRDSMSPLREVRDHELSMSLKPYADARGVKLVGVGDGMVAGGDKADRMTHWVSTITTPAEQDAILREVGSFADVKFRNKINGVYTSHAVANAVRSVHQAYLRRVAEPDLGILEAGASVKSAVMNGVDPSRYHMCCPVLDVRDSVRHSIRSWLEMVAASDGKYKESAKVAAVAALDPDSGFVCRRKTQDCSRQVGTIVSNESTHDIAFHDLPRIMARHGARVWTGFMCRAIGVRRSGGPVSGRCPVFGTRWRVDKTADQITFNFERAGNFSYVHKFSEWINYEEKLGYRWRGTYFDYIYRRLPLTTAATLAFAVVRVPKTTQMLSEPVYMSSGLDGMVEVTSIKAVGGCIGMAEPKFEPYVFQIEQVVFDRLMETRLAQGDKGNLASTISYMRSARVRLGFNGVALGAVSSVPVEILEPTAVAVEVLAADRRRAGARDFAALMNVGADKSALGKVHAYFMGLTGGLSDVVSSFSEKLRQALLNVLDGKSPIVVRVVPCPKFVRVSNGDDIGVVTDEPRLNVTGCGCTELTAARSALAMGSALSKVERRQLEIYVSNLRKVSSGCTEHNALFVDEEQAAEKFFDACETVEPEEISSCTTPQSGGSSCCDEAACSGSSVTSCTEETGMVSGCSLLSSDGTVCSDSLDDQFDCIKKESDAVRAMREYARWAQAADRCARSEAAAWYDTLFMFGNPTEDDLLRSTTSRTRHAVVLVVNSRVEKVVGSFREGETFAEVYSRQLGRTCIVHSDNAGRKYLKESITELCYASTDLKVMNGDALCRAALSVVQNVPRDFVIPRYVNVAGVPGSGKTFEIIQKSCEALARGVDVLYLTATVASKDSVISSVLKSMKSTTGLTAMTYDAYLMHGAVPHRGGSYAVAYFDEVGMAHKGQLFACAVKAGLPLVVLYGDPYQIPWLSFMDEFEAQYAMINDEFESEKRVVTHRFGSKTCAMWLDVYGEIYPCQCHEHLDELPEVVHISAASEIPNLLNGKVLTFTQEEKNIIKREMGFSASLAELKAMDNGGLSTVAEDQGGTHDVVYVARVLNKKNPKESKQSPSIYNRQPWVLVATTRHKSRIRYYTVASDDLVCSRLDLASCPVRLRAIDEQLSWDQIADVAQTVRGFGI